MDLIVTCAAAKQSGWVGSTRTLTISAKRRFLPDDNRDETRKPIDSRILPIAQANWPSASLRTRHGSPSETRE